MNVALIMQARSGSTRLPGKVLREVIPGRTMLDLLIERLKGCQTVNHWIVAVPDLMQDESIAREAARCGVEVYLGPEADVLTRYIGAAHQVSADIIVRVTSDCPLSDPYLIDSHVNRLKELWQRVDFVTNMHVQSFPLGLAVEAMPMDTLMRMDRLSTTLHLREHVTTLAYERPEWFLIDNLMNKEDQSDLRWTVDFPEDLEFVQAVYKRLYKKGQIFGTTEVLTLLENNPTILSINAHVAS